MRRMTDWITCALAAGMLLALGGFAVAAEKAEPAGAAKTDEKGWISLFNGKDLAGWHLRDKDGRKSWKVIDKMMVNQPHGKGNDIISDKKLGDFEVHFEFKIPKRSNSGLYLRGRYEIQIQDDYGKKPNKGSCGGIYGLVAPKENACKKPDEWQTFDAKIVGRTVTVVFNGKKVVDQFKLPRMTGRALDDKEGEPGPIFIQGDHGEIWVRAIKVRPIGGVQTTCPVSGKPCKPDIFTEYKGKKVYFCCKGCKPKFEDDPDKYLAKLPQFKK